MAAVAGDFLQIAASLMADSSSTEHHLRGAINRAYYAAYHEALLYADDLGLQVVRTNAGVHQQLVARFESSGKRHRMIGNRLASLKKMRADADYKLAQDFSQLDAQKHIAGCQRLIEELVRLRSLSIAQTS